MSKKYDVVARVGSYTDANGQEKGRFENVGAVITNQNGGFNLLLKKTFNPAGLAEPGKESIILSLFEPEQKEQSNQQRSVVRESPMANNPRGQARPAADDFDDDIPFMRLTSNYAIG